MFYYQCNINDWAAKTAHLSAQEEAILLRLTHLYISSEGALIGDLKTLSRKIRAADSIEVVECVLNEFFINEDNQWCNEECDDIIAEYKLRHEKRSYAGKKSGEARRNRTNIVEHCSNNVEQCSNIVEQTTNHKPETTNHKPETTNHKPITNIYPPAPLEGGSVCVDAQSAGGKGKKPKAAKGFTSIDCPDGVAPQVWADFLEIRKAKSAPVTQTAMTRLQSEADKANMSLQSVLELCIEKNWQGFYASWEHEKRDRRAAATEDRNQHYRQNNRDVGSGGNGIISQSAQAALASTATPEDDNPYRTWVPSYLRPENVRPQKPNLAPGEYGTPENPIIIKADHVFKTRSGDVRELYPAPKIPEPITPSQESHEVREEPPAVQELVSDFEAAIMTRMEQKRAELGI